VRAARTPTALPEPLRRRIRRTLAHAPIPAKDRVLAAGWRAWESYLALRSRDPRDGTSDDAGGLPVPPPLLRVLVTGSGSRESFLSGGRAQAELLRELVSRSGRELGELEAVLDLGCGCGRIARWWADVEGPRFAGCDVNRDLVAWCGESLPFLDARVNSIAPPLPFGERELPFDLVYAVSVFTHLPEPLQQRWLGEIRRVLRPGGHFIFTVSGVHYRDRLTGDDLAAYDAGQLVTHFAGSPGSNLCATFHPPAYVKREMLAGFELLDAERGGTLHFGQDVYLVRRIPDNT
jgi:SAM-dependent methyltransferase